MFHVISLLTMERRNFDSLIIVVDTVFLYGCLCYQPKFGFSENVVVLGYLCCLQQLVHSQRSFPSQQAGNFDCT